MIGLILMDGRLSHGCTGHRRRDNVTYQSSLCLPLLTTDPILFLCLALAFDSCNSHLLLSFLPFLLAFLLLILLNTLLPSFSPLLFFVSSPRDGLFSKCSHLLHYC